MSESIIIESKLRVIEFEFDILYYGQDSRFKVALCYSFFKVLAGFEKAVFSD